MADSFGSLFGEQILHSKKRQFKTDLSDKQYYQFRKRRIFLFIGILLLGLGVLYARLFALTVVEGGRFKKISEGNRIREQKIPSGRGVLYDRNGVALVRNIPLFISSDGEQFFESKPASVSGKFTETIAREYIYDDITAHVLGYTGLISDEQLQAFSQRKVQSGKKEYQAGDIVGKIGIEESYDELLAGKDGRQLVEVDALGNVIRTLGRVEPVVGNNINLTLDIKLQKIAAEQLQGKKGAVVISEPTTGAILALYSSPSFNPNQFIRGNNLQQLLSDSQRPLFNRAISGLYPPGSTFKIIPATAALQEGVIDKNTQIEDIGILKAGEFSFGNWYFLQYGKKDGFLNVVGAIKRSNDIFFYKLGEMVGIDTLAKWARKMGVGQRLGIDIEGEAQGLMPDTQWNLQTKGEPWYLGNTYHVAIGQGDVLVTPLQVNAWTNIVANGGKLCRPHLLSNLSDLSNLCKDIGIKKETINLVREGMLGACSPGGTGWPLFNFGVNPPAGGEKLQIDGVDFLDPPPASGSAKVTIGIPVACKTGTAEFGDLKAHTHAWITAFAPVFHPQISVTVLIEEGGEGSSAAGPVVKKILEGWFGGKM